MNMQANDQLASISQSDIDKVQGAHSARMMESAQSKSADLQARIEQRQKDIQTMTELNEMQGASLQRVKMQNDKLMNRLASLDKDFKKL